MMISCPKCQTQYDIADNLIPEEGRKFRCAKCGNVWMVTKEKPMENPPQASVPQEVEAIKENTVEQAPLEEISQEIVTEEEPKQEIEPKESETQEEIPDEVKAEEQENQETGAGNQNEEESAENESSEVSEDTSQEEKSEEIPDTTEITEEQENTEEKENPSDASMQYEEGAEIPEQLKQVNTASLYAPEDFGETTQKNKSSKKAFIFLLISLLISIYIGRFYIVAKFPPMQSVFEVIGISFDVLGEGLAFQDIKKEKLIVDDINYLVVEGSIINESEESRDVPNLILYLYDKDGKVIQRAAQKPPVSRLTPGETTDFKMHLEAPSVVAVEAEITFIETKKGRRR